MYSLEGKVALITGAARGMGAADARLFVQQGARVVLTDIQEDGLAIADELGDRAMFMPHDVASSGQWARVVEAARVRFGRIDILVNNAGIFRPMPLEDTEETAMDSHYRVNQLGVYLGMRSVIESMAAVGGGSIVNIASQVALQGHPGMFAYAASKWACRGMSRAAAADLAPHAIRVNSVYPGGIATPMLDIAAPGVIEAYTAQIPLRRFGTAEEVARLVLFLASDASAYVTGAEFVIDGGLTR